MLHDPALPTPLEPYPEGALNEAGSDATRRELRTGYNRALEAIGSASVAETGVGP